jgi:hypothetical protein
LGERNEVLSAAADTANTATATTTAAIKGRRSDANGIIRSKLEGMGRHLFDMHQGDGLPAQLVELH